MNDELSALNVLFTEFYYWVTVVIMFLIHVGFCLYEDGVSREKNKLNTLMKNAMLIPVITVSFFLFGWWIYFAFQNGPGITGGLKSAAWAEPFGELMGPHMGGQPADESLTTGDTATWARLNGVFWAAFLLFSWTAGSILSGAVIERIRSGAFWLLAVLVGSVTWVIDAAWGWSDTGWMVQKLGYHDAYASGVIHGLGRWIGTGDSHPPGAPDRPLSRRWHAARHTAQDDRHWNVSDLHRVLGFLERSDHGHRSRFSMPQRSRDA